MGLDVLRNTGGRDVVLRKVRLIESRGVTVTRSYITPLRNQVMVGAWSEFPPTQLDDESEENWQQRKPLEQAVVPGGEEFEAVIVVNVTADKNRGGFKSLSVEYDVAGSKQRYVFESVTAVRFREKCF